jgi:hypothetical protein
MSTEIKTIRGTHHVHKSIFTFEVERPPADIHVTRFYNGKELGTQVQITIQQFQGNGYTSYIHLSEEQCKELAQTLLEAFDHNKYPSE